MKEEDLGGEFAGLEARLRGADLAAGGRARDVLRARLLERAGARRRRLPAFAWLLPAAAAAALFVMFGPGRRPPAAEAPGYSAYALPDDGYGACGRAGLGDLQAADRY